MSTFVKLASDPDTIALGDFNAALHRPRYRNGPPIIDPDKQGLRFLNEISALQMRSVFTVRTPKRYDTYTFPNKAKKQLDHILCRDSYVRHVRNVQTLASPVPTGHRIVMARFKLHRHSAPVPPQQYTMWNALRFPGKSAEFDSRFESAVAERDGSTWDDVRTAINFAAECLPKVNTAVTWQDAQLFLECWASILSRGESYTDELMTALQLSPEDDNWIAHLRRLHQTTKSAEAWNEMCDAYDEILESDLERSLLALNGLPTWRQWRQVKKLLFERRKRSSIKFVPLPAVAEDKGDPDVAYDPIEQTPMIDDSPFTPEEVRLVAETMSRGKAPGDDGLPAEVLARPSIAGCMAAIFNNVARFGKVPDAWQIIKQVPIPKKATTEFRYICLLNSVVKLLDACISQTSTTRRCDAPQPSGFQARSLD
jgi:hypothetical protein